MQIYILLTESCNLNCSMCIRGRQEGSNMDIAMLKEIVKRNDFSRHDIVITGGEPSIHKELNDVVDLMCSNAKTVTITSNGTISDYINDLADRNNLYFQISLDGDEDIHDNIRGKGSFRKTWSTLQILDNLKYKYSVASVISKKNADGFENLLSKLEKLENMRFLRISYEMPFGDAQIDCDELMSAGQWNLFVEKTIEKARFRLKIQKIFPFDLYDKNMDRLKDSTNLRIRNLNCGSGKNKIYVYPDFYVYPCTCLTDFCVGNLSTDSLDEILAGEKNKQFADYALLEESKCYNCEYKAYCNGGCIGMSYHYFGKLGMGDKRCPKLKDL